MPLKRSDPLQALCTFAERGNVQSVALPLDFYDLPAEAVRARFEWAKRRGTPAWLWPDVQVRDWRAALLSMQVAIRQILGRRAPATAHLDGETRAMSLACYTSGMGPLLGWWRAAGYLSCNEEIGAVLDLHFRHNRLRAQRMSAAAAELGEALSGESIRFAVLKGADTAVRYFPDPATRPASDIDLLVPAEQALHAEQVLRAGGYNLVKRSARESDWRRADAAKQPRSLLLVHADDPWSVDLHTSLDFTPAAGIPLIHLDRAKPFENLHSGAAGLRQPLLLLHLAAHAGTGLHNLTLLRLVELHLVVRQDESSGLLDWEHFLTLGRSVGALGAAWPALKLVDDLNPGSIPQSVLQACALDAPPRVQRVVAGLEPATAQRLGGLSIAEHFMWANGPTEVLRQLAADLVPDRSWRAVRQVYERRLWQVRSGRVSR